MMEMLESSTDKILVIQASGEITDDDYQSVLIPEMQKLKDINGEIRTVIYFDDSFTGFTMGAMVDDAVFGMKNLTSFTKVSVVGLHSWLEGFVSLAQKVAPNVVKKFEFEEMDEALKWAKG